MKYLVASLILIVGLNSSSAQALQCRDLPQLMTVFLNNHFAINELNTDIKKRTVELFLRMADPGKQLLLKSDEEKIRRSLQALFESIKTNDCNSLAEVSTILTSRAEENFKIVTEKLKANFVLDKNAKFQTDAKKRDYPATIGGKESQIEAGIHVQIAGFMAEGDVTVDQAKQQLLKRYELSIKRAKEMTQTKMITFFAEAFAQSLDPHSDYLSPEELEAFKIAMNLDLEGIGVRLNSENGYTIVEEIVLGGSADRAKALKPKDKIIAVAQDKMAAVNIVDMDISDVLKLIRGDKGTKVGLTVLRKEGGKSKTFSVTLVRDKVDMNEQSARMVYETRQVGNQKFKIAVIELPSFYGGAEENARDSYLDLKELVEEANANKVDGMILDLSLNPGGLLRDAVKIAGLFIKAGPVVATQDKKNVREILADEDNRVIYSGPLLILTSPLSASASEILAGVMKDYRRALIVGGDSTFGKGSAQGFRELPMGLGAMKLTTQMFFLPKGHSTQYAGVTSNISMPSPFNSGEFGERNMDYALPPIKTEGFISMEDARSKDPKEIWTPVDDALVNFLKNNSSKRVAKNEEFKDIQKELKETKKNTGWIKVGDILNTAEKDKEKRKALIEEASTVSGRQQLWRKGPHLQESLNIMQDWLGYSGSQAQGIASKS